MRYIRLLVVILFTCNIFIARVNAANIIIDDEILNLVHEIALPIFKAANLTSNSVKIYLIDDNNINAFTAGGMSIFINSGLLVKFNNPYMLQGVIAHELGHILAGHITQRHVELRNAQNKLFITTILGVIGSAIAGSGDLAMASAVGSSSYIHQKILSFSRKQETEADQIALQLLYKANYSNQGVIELHKELVKKQHIIPEYFLTHPISESRIDHVKSFNKNNQKKNEKIFSKEFIAKYTTAIVKLEAYTESPERVLSLNEGNTINNIYAKAIAYYRLKQSKKALEKVKELIAMDDNDPYFYELAGQIYLLSGDIKQSMNNFQKSHDLLPNSPILSFQLALSYIHYADLTKNKDYYKKAIRMLNNISRYEEIGSDIFFYLSIAYGKNDEIGMARLSLAEKALIENDMEKAKKYAAQAEKILASQKNDQVNRAKQIIKLAE
jgi:predicted Zn-dependent protease